MVVTRKPAPASAIIPKNPSPLSPSTSYVASSEQSQDSQSAPPQMSGANGIGLTEPYRASTSVQSTKDQHIPNRDQLPESLRIGRPGNAANRSQNSSQPVSSNNPYRQDGQKLTGVHGPGDSSTSWAFDEPLKMPPTAPPPPVPVGAPPPVPTGIPPSDRLANLSISEQEPNPWQAALEKPQHPPVSAPLIELEDSGKEAWIAPTSEKQHAETHGGVIPSPTPPVLVDTEGDESPAWDEEGYDDLETPPDEGQPQSTQQQQVQHSVYEEDEHAWDDSIGHSSQKITSGSQFIVPEELNNHAEEWNVVDRQQSGSQKTGVVGADGIDIPDKSREPQNPPLPPRHEDQPPPQPPRPAINVTHPSSSSVPARGTPTSASAQRQRKETYEIKKITWHDVTSHTNPRVSPILVQNANGPCPLLALVNALTLSTPADVNTSLVECLRSREQVSLGLLLDAVFDELMSGRRGDAVQELPDVGDLYSFLVTLHTGMNVNPRFFPPPKSNSSKDIRNSMSHIHPSEREENIPGTFENTREMKLYGTFAVPLIHGWLPEPDSPAYHALWRSAKTYEDAQNLMFREEELEDKLQREGLSFEEQATLEDIATIKAFFVTAATQLTPHGLELITTSLLPGSVAILFRNDHFSTLYRHPDTLQLLQLVTDLGYASHEEVVWESLTDVNGENAEFFSGDFRLVGGGGENFLSNPQVSQSQGHTHSASQSAMSPNSEQEDHDLALALQLQEEEDARHRREQARRRRETELSETYIEQQGSSNSVPVSSRSSGRGARENRPPIPPRRSGPAAPTPRGDPTDVPPPTYEQAATDAPYIPPVDHPAHPSAPQLASQSQQPQPQQLPRQRRMSAFNAQTQAQLQSQGAGPSFVGPDGVQPNRRQGSFGQAAPIGRRNTASGVVQNEKDRECVIM